MLIRVAASGPGVDGWLDRARVAKLLEETPSIAAPSGERQRLQQALDAHAGNVAATARALGMSRQGLYKALHRNHLI
jgi:transcriptional regulator of acetoin/glycerol metabolism